MHNSVSRFGAARQAWLYVATAPMDDLLQLDGDRLGIAAAGQDKISEHNRPVGHTTPFQVKRSEGYTQIAI
jgi:hypothetical protein